MSAVTVASNHWNACRAAADVCARVIAETVAAGHAVEPSYLARFTALAKVEAAARDAYLAAVAALVSEAA